MAPLTQHAQIELMAIIATIAVLLALAYQVIAPFLVALAWGALGMFLGPTLLAVCHNVLGHWAFPQEDAPGGRRDK